MSVKHGSRVEIIFGGEVVGVITNFVPNEDTGLQPVYGIGHFYPQELWNSRYTGTFTFTKLLISEEKVQDLGWMESDGVTLKDLAKNFITQKGFNIEVKDKYSGQVFKTYAGCKIGTKGINITENAIIVENGNGQFINTFEPDKVK